MAIPQPVKQAKYRAKVKNTKKFKTNADARHDVYTKVRNGTAKKPSKNDACPNCGKKGFRKEFHHTKYKGKASTGSWRCSACNPRPGK